MSISGLGAGYPAWRETGKAQKNNSGTGFANKMAGADTAGSVLFQGASVRTAGQRNRQAVLNFGTWNHEL